MTVYGASDDLIEVDGQVREEFPAPSKGPALLAFSDGTVLRIEFSDTGVWRIAPVTTGTAELGIVQAPEADDRDYSDRATLTGEIRWVVLGSEIAKAGA